MAQGRSQEVEHLPESIDTKEGQNMKVATKQKKKEPGRHSEADAVSDGCHGGLHGMSSIECHGSQNTGRMMSHMKAPEPRNLVHEPVMEETKEVIENKTSESKGQQQPEGWFKIEKVSIEGQKAIHRPLRDSETQIEKRDEDEYL